MPATVGKRRRCCRHAGEPSSPSLARGTPATAHPPGEGRQDARPGDASSLASEDNGNMDPAGDQPGWRAEALRRVAAGPHAPAVAGVLLAVVAGTQALAQ